MAAHRQLEANYEHEKGLNITLEKELAQKVRALQQKHEEAQTQMKQVVAAERAKSESLSQQVAVLEDQLRDQQASSREASANVQLRLSAVQQQCADRLRQLQELEADKENLETCLEEERRRLLAEKSQTKLLSKQVRDALSVHAGPSLVMDIVWCCTTGCEFGGRNA